MKQEFDLVIRGGLVTDGSGPEPRIANVGIRGEKISAIGQVTTRGRREIAARGLLVTPVLSCEYQDSGRLTLLKSFMLASQMSGEW